MHTIRVNDDVSTSTPGFPYFSILLFLWGKTLISIQEIQISTQEDRGRQGKTETGLKMLNIYYSYEQRIVLMLMKIITKVWLQEKHYWDYVLK